MSDFNAIRNQLDRLGGFTIWASTMDRLDTCIREAKVDDLWYSGMHYTCDTTKRLMSSTKCRSVEVINNPARPGSTTRRLIV